MLIWIDDIPGYPTEEHREALRPFFSGFHVFISDFFLTAVPPSLPIVKLRKEGTETGEISKLVLKVKLGSRVVQKTTVHTWDTTEATRSFQNR